LYLLFVVHLIKNLWVLIYSKTLGNTETVMTRPRDISPAIGGIALGLECVVANVFICCSKKDAHLSYHRYTYIRFMSQDQKSLNREKQESLQQHSHQSTAKLSHISILNLNKKIHGFSQKNTTVTCHQVAVCSSLSPCLVNTMVYMAFGGAHDILSHSQRGKP